MPRSRFRLPVLAVWVAVLAALWPADPARGQRYPVERYTTARGMPSVDVTSLAQDTDGFLWFGTRGGLARYDGSEVEILSGTGPAAASVLDLHATADGSVWVAYGDGTLGRWRDGGFVTVAGGSASEARVRSVSGGREGHVWAAAEGGVLVVESGGTSIYEAPTTFCCRAALRDRRGRVWAGGETGLLLARDGRLVPVELGIPAGVGVNVLVEDSSGAVWAGTDRGIYHEVSGRFRRFGTPLGDDIVVLSAAAGESGRLWFGTERGAIRVAGSVDRVLSARNGLPDDHVNDILVDHEGTVWFATEGGAAKLVSSSFATYTRAQGLSDDYVVDTEVDGSGRVWVAGRSGVAVIDGAEAQPLRLQQLGNATIRALDITSSGQLLVGTSRGLIVRAGDYERGLGMAEGLPAQGVTAIETLAGDIWVGTGRGLFVGDAGGFRRAGSTTVGEATVTALAVDGRQRLWVGTAEHGLFVLRGGGFESVHATELQGAAISDIASGGRTLWVATNGRGVFAIRTDDDLALDPEIKGLASDLVPQIVVDGRGVLWVYSNQGLDRWDPVLGPTHYGLASGLADLAATPGAGVAAPDGRLWFGTPSGLTVYQPGADRLIEAAPRAVIRQVWVDGTPVTDPVVEVGPAAREITIAFAALSYRDEAATRFRYRLRGQSSQWVWLNGQRRVTFGQLSPGDYVFEVTAISASGEWSLEPATVPIAVRPAFWETTWFRVALATLVLGALLAIFRTRLRRVEDDRQRLRLMVDRRTRELVEKNSLLERMATTDELTGLPNRRFFLDNMERELRKLSRVPSPQTLSLLMLDIDHFKGINDRFGHAAGDEVLRALGRRLSQSVRATDLPARYGGEEFAILLPGTELEGARFLAEKLRSEVEAMDVRYEGRRIPVTISLGLASVAGTVRYERAVEEDLLRRADEAMYRAKEGGRNRVVADGEPDLSPEG